MIFAKIDFINLLPFYVFIKRHVRSSQMKQIINYKKSYPSKINKQFKKGQIDAAFISSIASKRCRCLDLGIVAKKEVLSVLLLKGENRQDYQSDTSNALAKVLKLQGEVMIGDKALSYYHQQEDHEQFIDLAQAWNDRYQLPFVFARLCANGHGDYLAQLAQHFQQTKVKIPQYILKRYVKRSGLTQSQILDYLDKISYTIGYKEKQSLKKFFRLEKKLKKH
jgi:chorismate dehydratase